MGSRFKKLIELATQQKASSNDDSNIQSCVNENITDINSNTYFKLPNEVTTWPKHSNLFYKITSNALAIEIKASGNAAIGFATKPGKTCDFWVAIGEHNRFSWFMKKGDSEKNKIDTLNILSNTEYRRFWITWSSNRLQLGRGLDIKPLLVHHLPNTDLQYYTLSVLGDMNPVHWKFELPPQRPIKRPKCLSGGELKWVPIADQLPDDAVIGGLEKVCTYVIRAEHMQSLTPGKFVPSEGTAYVSWGGEANEKSEFEVLCGYNLIWVPTSGNRIPAGAVVGGYSEDRQERLFVGRAYHQNHIVPGKVQVSHKCCYIPYQNKEIAKKEYEILVNPNTYNQYIYAIAKSLPEPNFDAMNFYGHEEEEDVDYQMNVMYLMPRVNRQQQ